jgi:hypothetical protein
MARSLRTAFGSLAVAALVLAGCGGDDGGDGVVDDNGVIENDDNGIVGNGDDAEPEFDRDVDDDRDSGNGAAEGIDNNPLDDD